MTEDLRDRKSIPESLADEPTRRKLAKARMRTRASLSRKLKVSLETVRRSEKRIDLYLSILRGLVEGEGGNLCLKAEFPDMPPVILAGLGENADENKGHKRAKKKSKPPAKSKARARRAA